METASQQRIGAVVCLVASAGSLAFVLSHGAVVCDGGLDPVDAPAGWQNAAPLPDRGGFAIRSSNPPPAPFCHAFKADALFSEELRTCAKAVIECLGDKAADHLTLGEYLKMATIYDQLEAEKTPATPEGQERIKKLKNQVDAGLITREQANDIGARWKRRAAVPQQTRLGGGNAGAGTAGSQNATARAHAAHRNASYPCIRPVSGLASAGAR